MEVERRLIKVTLEFDDEIKTLEGNAAESWLNAVNDAIVFNWTHSINFPKFNWKVKRK